MESTEATIRINWIVNTTVIDVRMIEDQWFVHFDGSRESMAFGHKSEPKPFEIGDEVEITFRKVKHAKP